MTKEKKDPEYRTWKDFALADKVSMVVGCTFGLMCCFLVWKQSVDCAQRQANSVKTEIYQRSSR